MAIAQGRRSYSFDYQDYDLGKLVVTVKNKYSDENGTAINFRYIYRITVVDKKARFEIFNIGVEYIYDNYDDGTYIFTNYTKDYNLNEFFPITDLHHKHWEEQLKALSSLDRSIKDGCLEMIGFIKNFEEDYNF